MLVTKRVSIVPTFACTMRCKLCSNHIPDFKNPPSAAACDMKNDIDSLFTLFDKIEWLQFVGGEIFMHKQLDDVFEYCKKYCDKFDRLIIETNATIMPTENELNVLLSYGNKLKVMISDYGEMSKIKNDLIEIFNNNQIEYVLKKYYGAIEEQHFGGWIDNSAMKDIGETQEEIESKAKNCAQVRLQNMHVFKGKLHRCSNSLFMSELGISTPNICDVVDLNDDTISNAEKIGTINNMYKQATATCRYCRWKDGDAKITPRYEAAVQEVR